MELKNRKYRALISSDWNECLAPCGPFDVIRFTYPSFDRVIDEIFKAYTANEIPLSDAIRGILSILPGAITQEQMDAYLESSFVTYRGVPELIAWCERQGILFMINTTGLQGYFQRVFKKGLLPNVPVISAHPMVRYDQPEREPRQWYDLFEIQDKPVNTQKVMCALGIPAGRVVVIGDSGGDGPHLEWGAGIGAFLVGSMTKWSLDRYCRNKGIHLDLHIGPRYSEGEKRNERMEMSVSLMDLIPGIEAILSTAQ